MPIPETISPTDRWGCPLCKRSITLYTEGNLKGSLRAHKAAANAIENPGGQCRGAGFSPHRPAWPQYVRLFGLDEAIRRVRSDHSDPEWTPEPMQVGEIQKFVMVAWPQAERFEMAPLTGERRGVTFSIGSKRWYFAAHDSFISNEFTSRADASDALYEYLKEN